MTENRGRSTTKTKNKRRSSTGAFKGKRKEKTELKFFSPQVERKSKVTDDDILNAFMIDDESFINDVPTPVNKAIPKSKVPQSKRVKSTMQMPIVPDYGASIWGILDNRKEEEEEDYLYKDRSVFDAPVIHELKIDLTREVEPEEKKKDTMPSFEKRSSRRMLYPDEASLWEVVKIPQKEDPKSLNVKPVETKDLKVDFAIDTNVEEGKDKKKNSMKTEKMELITEDSSIWDVLDSKMKDSGFNKNGNRRWGEFTREGMEQLVLPPRRARSLQPPQRKKKISWGSNSVHTIRNTSSNNDEGSLQNDLFRNWDEGGKDKAYLPALTNQKWDNTCNDRIFVQPGRSQRSHSQSPARSRSRNIDWADSFTDNFPEQSTKGKGTKKKKKANKKTKEERRSISLSPKGKKPSSKKERKSLSLSPQPKQSRKPKTSKRRSTKPSSVPSIPSLGIESESDDDDNVQAAAREAKDRMEKEARKRAEDEARKKEEEEERLRKVARRKAKEKARRQADEDAERQKKKDAFADYKMGEMGYRSNVIRSTANFDSGWNKISPTSPTGKTGSSRKL